MSALGQKQTFAVHQSARKSRGADHWDKYDYDVRLGDAKGKVVGRIFNSPHAPKDCPWFWTITELPRRPVDRGYVASRVEAMAEFKRYWDAEIQVK
jgi:hypothetical protein